MESAAPSLLDELAPLAECFPEADVHQLRSALALDTLHPSAAGEIQAVLRQGALSLPLVARAVESSPRSSTSAPAPQGEDAESLLDRLCRCDESSIELSLPTRAILGRAFVLAKLNLLKDIERVLARSGEAARAASQTLRALVGETIFTRLAEELLSASISNPSNPLDLRQAAARKLIGMWDERLILPVEELPSVLRSVWRARGKVRAVYGTLIGVNEVFSLIQAECPSRFVSYFVRDHVTPDEREAFREFLFGLPYEQLEQIKAYMEEHHLTSIGPRQIQEIIRSPVNPILFGDPSPEQMYNSYYRRRIRADYRKVTDSPGPRKTAEGYIMEALLREETGR
jgi:hypothetical protein